MSQLFKRYSFLFILLFASLISFSKNDTTSFNPLFRDSVLKNKVDSVKWNKLVSAIDIHKTSGGNILIQKQKHPVKSPSFLYITIGIFLILLILRLIFDDFSFSLLEGIASVKKFLIFYKSKKYDSLLAILSIYILKISILSLVVYIGLHFFKKDEFTSFQYLYFFNIWILLGLFFTIKNVIEFVFNFVIQTQETFKAFFLQNLFAEFLLSIVLLVLMLIYIYNGNVSYNFMTILMSICFTGYAVFNIVRSYQLMSNIRIPYKLHFFLYICAFKIIPMLLLAKYILNNIV